MRKRFSILVGLLLILIGGTALAFNILMPHWMETVFWYWGAWQLDASHSRNRHGRKRSAQDGSPWEGSPPPLPHRAST